MSIITKINSLGQVFLLTVFVISVAMFSSLLVLAPVRNKIIQIKEMENIYQAMANTEKAVEISYYYYIKSQDKLANIVSESKTTSFQTTTCGYLGPYNDNLNNDIKGDCEITTLKNIDQDSKKEFKTISYKFSYYFNQQDYNQNISYFYGYVKNIFRSFILRSTQ